ncbi:hypothetical protein OH77DRAFT_1025463 [Trametes cingulata]|nr:hypothetical protein OH77DRAFT_1025463 [Trametes cingulata]
MRGRSPCLSGSSLDVGRATALYSGELAGFAALAVAGLGRILRSCDDSVALRPRLHLEIWAPLSQLSARIQVRIWTVTSTGRVARGRASASTQIGLYQQNESDFSSETLGQRATRLCCRALPMPSFSDRARSLPASVGTPRISRTGIS